MKRMWSFTGTWTKVGPLGILSSYDTYRYGRLDRFSAPIVKKGDTFDYEGVIFTVKNVTMRNGGPESPDRYILEAETND